MVMQQYYCGSEIRAPAWYADDALLAGANGSTTWRPASSAEDLRRGPRVDRDKWTRAVAAGRQSRTWCSPQQTVMLLLVLGAFEGRCLMIAPRC